MKPHTPPITGPTNGVANTASGSRWVYVTEDKPRGREQPVTILPREQYEEMVAKLEGLDRLETTNQWRESFNCKRLRSRKGKKRAD